MGEAIAIMIAIGAAIGILRFLFKIEKKGPHCVVCGETLGEYFVYNTEGFLCDKCSPHPRMLFPPKEIK